MDIFFQSLPVPHKVRFHYHHFLLSIYSKVSLRRCFVDVSFAVAHLGSHSQVHEALETQRIENEMEERAMNLASGEEGDEGYPWSRREEMKALAITKGWSVFFHLTAMLPPTYRPPHFPGDPFLLEEDHQTTLTSTRRISFLLLSLEISSRRTGGY